MGVSVTWKSALWISVGKASVEVSVISHSAGAFMNHGWLTSLQLASIPLASHIMIIHSHQTTSQEVLLNGCTTFAWSDAGSFLPSIRLLVGSLGQPCAGLSLRPLTIPCAKDELGKAAAIGIGLPYR